MKKNKLIYLFLLPLVIFIWTAITYKIIDNIDPTPTINYKEVPVKQKETRINISDTFRLLLDYKDPFGPLRTEPGPQKINTSNVVKKTNVKSEVPIKQEVIWPPVQYSGMIRNQSKDKKLGCVIVNGASSLCSPGDSVSGLLIGRIYNDSIVLYKGTEQKVITKT